MVESAENIAPRRLGRQRRAAPAIILNVQRQPGANVIATVDAIKAQLPDLHGGAAGRRCSVDVLADRTTGIRASVHARARWSCVLAVVLVVLVIFVFLHSLRATVIASLAVPISLIGTCGVMYLLGYSLNNLSLMALTIATGFVVDDAIVMIENISRHIEDGEPPFEAALKGATQIGFTIISLTVSLIAVLIPLLFMGDVVGRLFREFAVTLAITILISAVVSLTLVPMMSARWLQPRDEAPKHAARFGARLQRRFDARRRALRPRAAPGCSTASRLTLLVALGDARAHRAALPRSSPRACSRPRTPASCRRASRPPQTSPTRAWPSCSRRRRARSCRTRRSRTSAPSSASTRPTTPCCTPASMLINLKADHGDQADGDGRACSERVAPGGRRDALPAADAGPDDRRRDRADRSTGSRSRAPTPRR